MCDCATKMNAKLREHNYQLSRNLLEGDSAPALIEMAKIERRKRAPSISLVATYCPFCGDRYEERKERGVLKAGGVR